MSLPNDVRMEDILLEDDEQDSIEYKILMAYAQRRLPARKYRKLQENKDPPSQPGEPADVGQIADKLAKLVTDTSISCQVPMAEYEGGYPQEDKDELLIRSIVSLLKQKGDQLEEKMKRDRVFYQCFQDMLSYNFFRRIIDRFLRGVSAYSPGVTGDQAQRLKIAYTMEVATRLSGVDNHLMKLVMVFGSKYLREHFKPWIQDQGGWKKAVTSPDEEEVK